MKLSICTDVMGDLSFTEMLDKCVKLGVEGIEMTGGGWSRAPHFRADELLSNKQLLRTKLKEIEARGLEIAALNCSANPLDPGPMGERHRKEMEQTIRLAGEIGVKTIVTMSGLPAAAPGDTVPNWLVYTKSWPDEMPERDRYQWEDCAIPATGKVSSGWPTRRASKNTRSRTSAPCWSGTPRRCFACATRSGRRSA